MSELGQVLMMVAGLVGSAILAGALLAKVHALVEEQP